MKETYCIKNAPKQHGDLWLEVTDNNVKVMDPAGKWWRGKTFTIEEFHEEFCQAHKEVKCMTKE